MGNFVQLLKVAGPRMIPFLKTVILYFVLKTYEHHDNIWSTVLKCVPIYCLMIFVLLSGFNLTKEYQFSQRILLGLLFSSFGDALLNWNLFPHGMGAFAVAQICYISAFGLRPLKPWIPLVFYAIGAGMIFLIFENLPDIIKVGLPIYGVLLWAMAWRAVARIDGEYSSIAKVAGAAGGILFAISDCVIAVNMFYAEVPYAQILIMSTYYAAQFGITLSIIDLSTTENVNIHKSSISEETDSNKSVDSVTAAPTGVRKRVSGSATK